MRRKRKASEESLQTAVSSYIKLQFPDVMFTAESSGIRLTIGQAVKAKKQRSQRGLPDMIILEPRGKYHGLCLELKKEGSSPFKKDGTLKAGQHLLEQSHAIRELKKRGYFACFCSGFYQSKEMIDAYMRLPRT